jgi:acyl-CoA synthetase (AMP-forming)/AMP-acid ligase II
MAAVATLDLSPDPLLDLIENYTGSFLDLDHGFAWDGSRLRAARDQLSTELRRLGVEAGDRVLFAIGNGPCFPAALAAVLVAGACPILLHFETPPGELNRLAANYQAAFALCESWPEADLRPFSTSTATLDLGPSTRLTFAALRDGKPAGDAPFTSIPSVPLHPTSGTTGLPKMAVRHGAAAVAEARHYQRTMGITAEDTIFCVVPMSHAYGFGTSVTMPLLSGAKVVSSRRFQPHLVARNLKDHAVTTFPAVPAMLHLLLVAARGPMTDLPPRVLSAGAPLPQQTAEAFFDRAGRAVQSLYGSTETGGIAVDVNAERSTAMGCVGPAMESVSVEVRATTEPGTSASVNGLVCVKSPSMMAGYLTPQGIDASHIVDGWFQTGDLGYLDAAGRICLVGRESEVINVFGLKVIPSEVEAVIRQIAGVTDVKVYAGQHRSGSQIVKAAIAAPVSIDIAAVREHCARQLVGYKRPEVITRLDSLPRNSAGKIIRDQLP